jgi:AcrR family transcriptional regulator
MTEPESTSTERKIIDAAIECIEKYGIQGTTNRRIAEMAGVNNAAINYYFRSKDALVQRCMDETLHNAFDWEDYSALPRVEIHQRCIDIFHELLVGGVNYPGITRAHFYEVFTAGRTDVPSVKRFNEFLENLALDLEDMGTDLSPEELRLALIQITSAVMMMIIAPRFYFEQFGLDITVETDRVQFITRLVNKLL